MFPVEEKTNYFQIFWFAIICVIPYCVCSDELPSLKPYSKDFPAGHFCNSQVNEVIKGDKGFIAQCGLEALRVVRRTAKISGDSEWIESYQALFQEFSSTISTLTYTVSYWGDNYGEIGATWFQARRKCQVCGGRLATKNEVKFVQSVSKALQFNNWENQNPVLTSQLGYWYIRSADDLHDYKMQSCPFLFNDNFLSSSDCGVKGTKQFICWYPNGMKDECLEESSVCRSSWQKNETACGCTLYNTVPPPPLPKTTTTTTQKREPQPPISVERRVIGGSETSDSNKWPFFVSVGKCQSGCVPHGPKVSKTCVGEIEKGTCTHDKLTQLCGATILNSRWILTAGHCFTVNNPAYAHRFYVAGGSLKHSTSEDFDGRYFAVSKIVVHPWFIDHAVKLENDIALIQIEEGYDLLDIKINSKVSRMFPACLPSSTDDKPKDGTIATLLGLGQTYTHSQEANTLREVALTVVDCSKFPYPSNSNKTCAGNTYSNICGGDSGGPLLCDNVDGTYFVCGVASHSLGNVVSCTSTPGAFTNVASYLPWIKSIIW